MPNVTVQLEGTLTDIATVLQDPIVPEGIKDRIAKVAIIVSVNTREAFDNLKTIITTLRATYPTVKITVEYKEIG